MDGYSKELGHIALELPRPRRRSRRLLEALLAGKSVVWFYPRTLDPSTVVSSLKTACAELGLEIQEVDVASRDGEPLAVLWEMPGWGDKSQGQSGQSTPRDMFGALVQQAPDVVILKGLERMEGERLKAWARFVSRWAAHAHAMASAGHEPKRLLVPSGTLALDKLLTEDVFLSKHWYWGWLGEPEIHVLVQEVAHDRAFGPLDEKWAEASLVELVGTDTDLLVWLMDGLSEMNSTEALVKRLCDYARVKGWEEFTRDEVALLEQLGTHSADELPLGGARLQSGVSPGVSLEPPLHLHRVWWKGWLSASHAEGLYVHSAVLALLGRHYKIEHRMWRGQARLLLPVIDAARLRVCRFLSNAYRDWRTYCSRSVLYGADLNPNHGSGVRKGYDATAAGETQGNAGHAGRTNARIRTGASGRSDAEPNRDRKVLGRDEDPWLAEFPDITAFLNEVQRHSTAMRALRDGVQRLRVQRNELAHYRPLTRQQFDELWRALSTVYRHTAST